MNFAERDRHELIKTLSDLPAPQFEQIIFTFKVPGGVLPASSAPQGERAAMLLAWAERTGPGLKSLQALLSQVLGKELPTLSGICPYKGLSYFDCNDEDYKYFYGREALTRTLLDKVSRDNFLAIVGASGSGKSSVLRAGLLQRLKDKGGYEIRILVPGEHPLQSLALAFVAEGLERLDRAEQQQKAKKLILAGAEGLCALVETSAAKTVVLIVDQFEEAFTLCQDRAERQAFFETLLGGLEAAVSRLCLILAMRSDFVGKCFEQDYGGLAEKVKTHLEPVLPMSVEELTEAIAEPARQTGITLEPGLTQALLKDVESSPGGLPLLQYTLTELWHQQHDYQLKLSVYHQLGGVTGTLKQRADEVYESLSPEQQQTAKHIFLNLTHLGEGAEDTRRRITQESLMSAQHPEERVLDVVKRLADANLVVTDDRGESAKGDYSATVDVAHEALIRNWPKLRQWLEENQDLLRQQRKIELAAEEWKVHKRYQNLLLEGRALSDALRFQKEESEIYSLSNTANAYLKQSKKARSINRFKLASWLIIPTLGLMAVFNGTARNQQVAELRQTIEDRTDGSTVERQAVILMVEGCRESEFMKLIPWQVIEIFAGNCRTLQYALLNDANLSGADLRAADLPNADLRNADLRSAKLRSANLVGADLSYADLSYAILHNAILSSANFSSANLRSAHLRSASFYYTDLRNTFLINADLRDAFLRNADLRNANLSYVDLRNADLHNAILSSAILLSTDFRNGQNLTPDQFKGDTAPLLCNTSLPYEIEEASISPDRDCDYLGQVLAERYGYSLEEANQIVDKERQRKLD